MLLYREWEVKNKVNLFGVFSFTIFMVIKNRNFIHPNPRTKIRCFLRGKSTINLELKYV